MGGTRLTITVKEERMPIMKEVSFAETGTKPDLMPGVVMLGVERLIGTQGAAKDDCVTVWFWKHVSTKQALARPL